MGVPEPLARTRLHERFDESAAARVICVTGIAGAGKTTAVRSWLKASSTAHTWLALDSRDNDTERLLGRLGAAVAGEAWNATGEMSLDRLDELIAVVPANAQTVVLDDLHFVVEPQLLEWLAYLVTGLPERLRIVLVSRSAPPAQLDRLLAEGALARIDGAELAFTADEIAELLSSTKTIAERVLKVTGGWPLAVGLSRGLVAESGAGIERRLRGGSVAASLTREALRTLPAELQELARDAAVLDLLTPFDVDAVLGIDDSGRRLDRLAERGMFLSPVASGWVMHGVIRDLLRDELERRSPKRARELNLRAAERFADADPPRAIAHALEGEHFDFAADLFQQRLPELKEVLYASQLRWLQALPASAITSRPALCAHAALVAAYERRHDLAARWLRDRRAAEPSTVEELGSLTMQYVVLGDMPRLLEAAARLNVLVDEDSTLWHLSHGALAGALYATDDHEAAVEVMAAMLRSVRECPAQFLAVQCAGRAVICVLMAGLGRLAQARVALAELRDWVAEAQHVEGYADLGAVQWADAMCALAADDVLSAGKWQEPPSAQAALGLPFLEVWLNLDFAAVRMAAGDDEAARRALYRAQSRLSRFAHPGMLEDRLREVGKPLGVAPLPRPSPFRHRLPAELSDREADVLRLLDSDLSTREIAEHLFLSPNTLKTHMRAVYRKLGVSSRLSAVRSARSHGLIGSGPLNADDHD